MYQKKEHKGVRHYYEVTGEGEWLVLIHGWAGSTIMWKKEMEYLPKYFKVLNYDLRGHAFTGNSEVDEYDLKLVADDLASLMDELKIDKAHLCSLSLGSIVAQGFQLYYPERIKSQVLIGPPAKYNGLSKLIMNVLDKVVAPLFGYRAVLEGLAYTVMPSKAEKISRKFFIQESKKLSTEEIRKWWKVIYDDSFFDDFPQVSVPTLILVGAGDWFLIKNSTKLVNIYTNSQLHIFPETGHVVTLQNPERCKGKILDFYKSLGIIVKEENYSLDKAANQ